MIIHENFSLKRLNTFGIDVSTKYFAEINSTGDLKEIILDKKFASHPKLVLGGGSNVLFTKNFDGLIIHPVDEPVAGPGQNGITVVSEDDSTAIVKANAAVVWHNLVLFAIDK